MDAFKGDLDEHLKDYPKQLTRGMGEMIEVLPPGSSKAVGLEALLKELGIPAEEVMMANVFNDIYPSICLVLRQVIYNKWYIQRIVFMRLRDDIAYTFVPTFYCSS